MNTTNCTCGDETEGVIHREDGPCYYPNPTPPVEPTEEYEECQWENCSGGKFCKKHSLLTEPTQSTWQDRYCKEFGLCKNEGKCQCKKELKFISQTLLEEKRKVLEEVKNWADENMADGNWDYEKLLIFINKLKQK